MNHCVKALLKNVITKRKIEFCPDLRNMLNRISNVYIYYVRCNCQVKRQILNIAKVIKY